VSIGEITGDIDLGLEYRNVVKVLDDQQVSRYAIGDVVCTR